METIDCRGLNCPEPVLRTKTALKDNPFEDLTIIVDNEIARENVMRFIRNQEREPSCQEIDKNYHISVAGNKAGINDSCEIKVSSDHTNNPVLFISTDQLGQGSRELGQLLMRNFIYTLTKRDNLPDALVLMNSGVKLSIKESPVAEELETLEERGVLLLVCGTCLDYYELKEQHKAGQISNMYDIADLLFAARQVITV